MRAWSTSCKFLPYQSSHCATADIASRGKKVYRRFEDDEEEEEIDTEDLGLLEHTRNGTAVVKPMKTLTRKSIRPTRLFQTEEQKTARELEKEEEAATEIEDNEEIDTTNNGDIRVDADTGNAQTTEQTPHKLSKSSPEVEETPAAQATTTKRKSPFDSWKRVKKGSGKNEEERAGKSRKRSAAEALDETEEVHKKVRSASG